jgi:hypothetical protein
LFFIPLTQALVSEAPEVASEAVSHGAVPLLVAMLNSGSLQQLAVANGALQVGCAPDERMDRWTDRQTDRQATPNP